MAKGPCHAHLRPLSDDVSASASLSFPLEAKDASENEAFGHALARWQARLNTANATNGALSAQIELASANDRIAQLECQLLDAEETICHLRAEKLAALRDVERLRNATFDARQVDDFPHKQLLELETRLADQKQFYTLEQAHCMAIIQDQKHELTTLRGQLEETILQYKELQQRHVKVVKMDPGTHFNVCEGGDGNDNDIRFDNEVVGRARAPADADTVNSKWQEELVRHPTPHFDLESPEVAYLLRAWTKNMKKMRYMRRWLLQVANTTGPLPTDFPTGVELPRLPPEVRDGFLTLVLPLLRKQTYRDVLVHCRQYNDGIHTDLRFRIVPRT